MPTKLKVTFQNINIYQILTLYTLNAYDVIPQLCLNKTGKRDKNGHSMR